MCQAASARAKPDLWLPVYSRTEGLDRSRNLAQRQHLISGSSLFLRAAILMFLPRSQAYEGLKLAS